MASLIKLEVNHSKHQNKANQKKETKPPLPAPLPLPKQTEKEPELKNSSKVTNPPQKLLLEKSKPTKEDPKNKKKGTTQQQKSPATNKKQALDPKQKKNSKNKDSKTLQPPRQQQTVVDRIEHSRHHISHNLQDLLSEYKSLASKDYLTHGHSLEKEAAVREFLAALKREKRERRRRLKQIQSSPTKRERLEKQMKFEADAKIKQQKLEIQKRAKQRILSIKQIQEKRQQQKQRWQQFYQQFKARKPLHIKMEKKFEEQMEKDLEDQEAKLDIWHQRFQPMDSEQLDQHIEKYQEFLEQRENQRHQKQFEQAKQIRQENIGLFKELWRGECHVNARNQRLQAKQKKNEPKQIRAKIKQYRQFVRKKFKPKPKVFKLQNSTEIASNQNKSVKQQPRSQRMVQRKRYKFVKGVSLGEVEQKVPAKRTLQQQKKLGDEYLKYLRSLPKKKKDDDSSSGQSVNFPPNDDKKKVIRKDPIERYEKQGNPLYQSSKRKYNSFSLPKNASPYQMNMYLQKMRDRDQKIFQQQEVLKHQQLPSIVHYHDRQKQVNDRLFQSVEQKLNLLSRLGAVSSR